MQASGVREEGMVLLHLQSLQHSGGYMQGRVDAHNNRISLLLPQSRKICAQQPVLVCGTPL